MQMKLIEKIKNWIKSFLTKVDEIKDKYLPVAVHSVQVIKKAIENGTVDTIADIAKIALPDVGDAILDKVVKYATEHIPRLCIQLEILNASNVSGGDVEVLKIALDELKDTYGDKWEQFTSGLAGEILVMLADGKIDAKEAKELAKAFYDEHIKGVE